MTKINPAFIPGRSSMRNFFELLDNGSEKDLLELKAKLLNCRDILDDKEVLQKCEQYIRYIDEELLARQELQVLQ